MNYCKQKITMYFVIFLYISTIWILFSLIKPFCKSTTIRFFIVFSYKQKTQYRPRVQLSLFLVPREGLEPTHPCGYRILSPTRLPISPSRHIVMQLMLTGFIISYENNKCNSFEKNSSIFLCKFNKNVLF